MPFDPSTTGATFSETAKLMVRKRTRTCSEARAPTWPRWFASAFLYHLVSPSPPTLRSSTPSSRRHLRDSWKRFASTWAKSRKSWTRGSAMLPTLCSLPSGRDQIISQQLHSGAGLIPNHEQHPVCCADSESRAEICVCSDLALACQCLA